MLAVSLGPQQPAGQQQFPALAALCTGGSLAMTADNGYGSPIDDVMSLDCAGSMILKGSIVSDGRPIMRVGAPGHVARAAYAAEQARPAIEDDGEGSIDGGAGYVAIDTAFAQAADVGHGYSVFLTPEGPSLGLYVTDKSPSGFAVRENPGGHASIGFAYRIVATPLGAQGGRLPDMASVQTTLYREAAAALAQRGGRSCLASAACKNPSRAALVDVSCGADADEREHKRSRTAYTISI